MNPTYLRSPSRPLTSLHHLRWIIVALPMSAGALVGCGDGSDGKDGDSGTTEIQVTGSGDGDGDGDGTTGGSISESDGGRVDLTAEQIEAIEDAACTGWVAEGETLPAVLQLVVDTSRSMTEGAPGSNRSKWDVTRAALVEAVGDLPPAVSVGLMFYPNTRDLLNGEDSPSDISACIDVNGRLPIEMLGNDGSAQREALENGIMSVDPEGYTPTHDAYRYALNEALIPYETSASKFMLLITDGAPTVDTDCVATGESSNGSVANAETQPIVDEIARANSEHDIRTFLIGSPGSEVSADGNGDMRPWLSQAAVVGGTASEGCAANGPNFCHMDMTQEEDFASALTAGLASVVGQIVNACEFVVPEPPDGEGTISPNKTNLIITWGDGSSSLILPDGKGDCKDGWQWDDAAGTVNLCGETCDEVKLDSKASVQLSFGCSTDDIITR